MPYVVAGWIFGRGRLDRVGDEAEYGADPQQQREAAEQLLAELYPLRSRFRRTQLVGSVASQNCLSTLRRMTLDTHTQYLIISVRLSH